MKKTIIKTATCLLVGATALQSCIGSFSLFNNLLSWNKGLSNKFVNEVVFVVISPVYALCGVADLFVLNTVEFWSGANPIAKVGQTKNVWGQDGRQYAVKTLEDGYEITAPDGLVTRFAYDKEADAWSMEQGGVTRELFRFNGDGTVNAVLPSGERMDVSLNEAGVYAVRMAVNDGAFFAQR